MGSKEGLFYNKTLLKFVEEKNKKIFRRESVTGVAWPPGGIWWTGLCVEHSLYHHSMLCVSPQKASICFTFCVKNSLYHHTCILSLLVREPHSTLYSTGCILYHTYNIPLLYIYTLTSATWTRSSSKIQSSEFRSWLISILLRFFSQHFKVELSNIRKNIYIYFCKVKEKQ